MAIRHFEQDYAADETSRANLASNAETEAVRNPDELVNFSMTIQGSTLVVDIETTTDESMDRIIL
jgi:hypothetical protein